MAFKKLSGMVLEFPFFANYEIQCPDFAFLLNLLHKLKDIKTIQQPAEDKNSDYYQTLQAQAN